MTAASLPPAAAPGLPPPRRAPWPRLREELTLHRGPVGADGAPSWSLQDPSRQQFFRIDWPSFEILSRWHLADAAAIAQDVEQCTPLALGAEDVERVSQFLAEHELVQAHTPDRVAALNARHRASRTGAAHWLLHHYLFFRVPLLRPDRWLQALLPWAAPFYSRTFLHLTLGALLAGLWMVTRQWEQFTGTLVDMLTPAGFARYGLMLVAVKALHELGHAVTAKRLGCRVPTMGVAFLVMWPVAYTDVTEAWKLTRRQDRLAVGAAGIATELALAAWATLAWALLPDGGLRSLCFVLATTTWISTLLINASPIMRFDGYFLLSDLLDMPNLHTRAFALARWRLREALFALGEEPPEHFPPARANGLVLFAFAVWAYRLVLFLGIAAMVYHHFFKALGLFLFFVEIGWFVVMPIWNELRAWRARWPVLRQRRRAAWSLGGLAALLLVAALPWQSQVQAQGLLRPRHYPLHAAVPGQLQEWALQPGQAVVRDQPLYVLASPELQLRDRSAALKLARSDWQVGASGFDETLRARQTVLQEERRGAQAEQAGLQEELARLAPRAPFDGLLVDVPPDLRPGSWVA
ncbi:MAG: secretion protein HylD, partial [Comamonadaceae bacterium]